MEKAECLISRTNDPYLNLAIEDYIFNSPSLSKKQILFLWRNSNCVIVGRNQNPWLECNLERIKKDGIKLVRRGSGGGAVYQDLGNSIFTFMSPKSSYDKKRNFKIITDSLKKFDISAEQIGRNDLCVNNLKISGSAFKEKLDRALHHGTLLINVNLFSLSNYLTPTQKKLESKGITSVNARVANLVDFNEKITHENICNTITEKFFLTYQSKKNIKILNHESLKQIPELENYYNVLKSDEWIFGETKEFSHMLEKHFSWGNLSLNLNTNKGVIVETKIFSDCLNTELIDALEKSLENIPYDSEHVQQSLNSLTRNSPALSYEIREVGDWLLKEI